MASDNDCPRCERNIGMWAVFRASLPNRIFCPRCGTRLEYGGTGQVVVVGIVLTVGILVVAAGAFAVVNWLVALGILVIGFGLLEVGLVLHLWYGGYRLQEVGRPRRIEDEETDW